MRYSVPIFALLVTCGLVCGPTCGVRSASAQANPNPPTPTAKAEPGAEQNPAPPVDPNQPLVVTLTLSAAGEPVPALKYELLPRASERKPGNAATNYYRAVVALRSIPDDVAKDESKWFAEFGDDAYRKVPRERLQRWIAAHERALAEMRQATYRESCDWGLRMQDLRGMDTVSFLIEEFQQLRWIIRPLNMKTRVAIEQGRYDDAYDLLRTQYQAARDVSLQPNIICGLVGIAFSHQANERIEQWIGSPGSPNLYWALVALPRPLVSLREGLDQERSLPERLLPFLADAETTHRSKEEWQRLLVDAVRQMAQLNSYGEAPMPGLAAEAVVLGMMSRGYPIAKRELLATGFDAARLEAMPVGQVVAIHLARSVRANYDSQVKGYYLPYDQAVVWSQRASVRANTNPLQVPGAVAEESLPISRVLLPALDAVLRAEIRNERSFRALQAIEAIRLHMTVSGGRLPKTLDEIEVVPVPRNPATQQPFPYRLEGDGAVLEVPTVAGEPGASGRKYLIRTR
ncbi:MAG TPA: hypothetical protein PLV92_16840 [Pirellulaceae bacterium]|nr:hypothetical protein [Pirellulaceae bacterium]